MHQYEIDSEAINEQLLFAIDLMPSNLFVVAATTAAKLISQIRKFAYSSFLALRTFIE